MFIMGTLNNFFFPYPKRKKEVISLVFALKGGFKNIVFQTAIIEELLVYLDFARYKSAREAAL